MNQPTLEEFGIQPRELMRAETAKNLLIAVSLICMVAGLVYISNFKRSSGWLILFVLPPYGPFIIYFSLKALLRVHWPAFHRAMRYASA